MVAEIIVAAEGAVKDHQGVGVAKTLLTTIIRTTELKINRVTLIKMETTIDRTKFNKIMRKKNNLILYSMTARQHLLDKSSEK